MSYALITGASSGIGRHYASELASRGYNIVAVSNQPTELQLVVEHLRMHYGVEAHALCCDLTDSHHAEQLYDTCHSNSWQVDVLVCNAGILLFSTLVNTDTVHLKNIITLHCTTTTLLCRLFGDDMKQRRTGHILIMSSATAWLPYPTISHYGATKAYLKNFASSLWYELRPYNVSVTAIFPGAVDTPFYTLNDNMRRWLCRLGVMLPPATIARRGVCAMFKGRRRLIPGLFTKVVVAVCALLPARILYPILRIGAIRRLLERV